MYRRSPSRIPHAWVALVLGSVALLSLHQRHHGGFDTENIAAARDVRPALALAPDISDPIPPTASVDPDRIQRPTARDRADIPPESSPRSTEEQGRPRSISVKVGYGDSLISILSRHHVGRREAHRLIHSLRKRFNPRHLRTGDTVRMVFLPGAAVDDGPREGSLRVERMEISRHDAGKVVGVAYADPGFADYERYREVDRRTMRAENSIEVNFSQSALDEHVPADVIEQMITALQNRIDFQRDIRLHDRFRLIYEALFDRDQGDYLRGTLIFAEIHSPDKDETHQVFRFTRSNGKTGLFDAAGKNVLSSFLKPPISQARISSRYGMRKDPFLGYRRMHYGVDYSAARGTAVRAAASGKVTRIGRYGNYGKYVEIAHDGRHKTAYAHLHSYAKGLKKGSHVTQGQIIGTVGSTGRSTGPHLHFEVRVGNRRVNPAKFKMFKVDTLGDSDMAVFRQKMAEILTSYASLEDSRRIAALGGD